MDLTTHYMGFKLNSPIIAGSSGITNSVDQIAKLAANGAGAIVLKSIFEEQIMLEANSLRPEYMSHTEADDYIDQYTRNHSLDEYLKLIEVAQKEVDVPVIASVNCATSSEWVSFAKTIEEAGADGLELNVFILPGDRRRKGEEIEQTYFDIIREVKERVSIPIAVKMSSYFSGMANMIFNLSIRGIKGLVLFNRFYSPDVDLKKMEIHPTNVFSNPKENGLPLRWIGMMSGEARCDLAASSGIHDGQTVIKNLLVGAKAAQVASVLYKKGPEYIRTMLDEIKAWMTDNKVEKIEDIIGKLSQKNIDNPVVYERSQFMKYYSEYKETI